MVTPMEITTHMAILMQAARIDLVNLKIRSASQLQEKSNKEVLLRSLSFSVSAAFAL